MSLFNFPFFRKSLPTVGNPVAIDDILAGNQLTIDGLSALTGLPNPGFAIIQGMAYTAGSPGSYAPGYFWLNGQFYWMQGTFSENVYLTPSSQDLNNEQYSDLSVRATYTQFIGLPSSSGGGPSGSPVSTPQFSGNMNAYRIGNNDLANYINAIQGTIATLKGGAFLNVGTGPGTLAAGDDSRFGYSTTYQDANFARILNVLIKGSANGNFVPTQPYDPATKQYVDSVAGLIVLAKGTHTPSGSIPTGNGLIDTVPISPALLTTSYMVLFSVNSLSVGGVGDTIFAPQVRNKQLGSFDLRMVATSAEVPNITIDWKIVGL